MIQRWMSFTSPGRARKRRGVEVYPGLSLEKDASGELIGVEILQASELLKGVIDPLRRKVAS